MTCRECERLVLESKTCSGSKAVSPDSLDLAQAHLEDCAACAMKVSEISKLNSALNQFRVATSQMNASSAVELRLLAAFHRQARASKPGSGKRRAWRMSVAATAALFVLVWGFWYFSPQRSKPQDARVQLAATNKSTDKDKNNEYQVANGPLGTEHDVGVFKQAVPATISSRHAPPRSTGARQVYTGSVLTNRSYPREPDESTQVTEGNVVRITLPSSALAALGIPVHPDLTGRRVIADVVMDSFGVVHGIRLVGSESKTD